MNKRHLIFICAILLSGIVSTSCSESKEEKRPNIIYIFTDQQSATMMSCAGNKYLETPGMDYLAEKGVRFTRAYATNPVCSPARVSLMTGRFPGFFDDKDGNQARENDGSMKIPQVSDEVLNTSLASFLKKADYELFFGGKEHLPPHSPPRLLALMISPIMSVIS